MPSIAISELEENGKMRHAKQTTDILSVLVAWGVCVLAFLPAAYGKEAPLGSANNAAPPLIQQMVGTWKVHQRMWPGAGAKAIELPPAVAHRVLTGGSFLHETMTLTPGSNQAPFTRESYFDYNPVDRRYEYFSLDTRAPEMMNERSRLVEAGSKSQNQAPITLYGGKFIAPQWGNAKNVPFRYRIVVGDVNKGKQTVRLYLTPLSGGNRKEFLAFEYVYTRNK
jgi:Protein of unknown function (DUF1579)